MTNEPAPVGDRYRWVALVNTTASMFMATLDGSIVIIALPAIFRGIGLDPLAPGSIFYLLWMIMGYRLVQAVLVVTLGRLGDMYGRVTDMTARRPSSGSDWRWTRPRASSVLSVAPIDCALICSPLASAVTVAGPPRSRRRSAADSGSDSSPGACSCRRRRRNRPTLRYTAAAIPSTSCSVGIYQG